jgi:hypothetical protein
MHAQEADYSRQQNVISRYFVAMNNTGNTRMDLTCMLQEFRRLLPQKPTGPVLYMPFLRVRWKGGSKNPMRVALADPDARVRL